MAKTPSKTKLRTCLGCGKDEMVLPSNTSPRCLPCGRAFGSALKSSNYRVGRECRCCRASFTVPKSIMAGSSNASGNFCSRPCYAFWLRRTPGPKSDRRGEGWRTIRNAAISRAPFRALCGTRRRLQVHHIVPWRISGDNSQANLIPLCVSHHRLVEMATVGIEHAVPDPQDVPLVLAGLSLMLRFRQAHTATVIRRIAA